MLHEHLEQEGRSARQAGVPRFGNPYTQRHRENPVKAAWWARGWTLQDDEIKEMRDAGPAGKV